VLAMLIRPFPSALLLWTHRAHQWHSLLLQC
jgi:hypothetical protein